MKVVQFSPKERASVLWLRSDHPDAPTGAATVVPRPPKSRQDAVTTGRAETNLHREISPPASTRVVPESIDLLFGSPTPLRVRMLLAKRILNSERMIDRESLHRLETTAGSAKGSQTTRRLARPETMPNAGTPWIPDVRPQSARR